MAEPVVKVQWSADWLVMTVDVIGAGKPPIVADLTRCNSHMLTRLKAYGAEVRITRAAAIARDLKSGKSATPAEKYDAILRMANHITSGTADWNAGRSERIGLDETILSQAMALAFPARSADEIRAKVTGADAFGRLEMRDDPRVQPHYAKLLKDLAGGKAESVLADW